MKRLIPGLHQAVVIVLLCASVEALAQPGPQSANPESREAKPQEAPAGRAIAPRPENAIYNLNGRLLGPDEAFVAARTLPDGRTIAYRQNETDVALLVEALREDGVVDEKLLTPQSWLLGCSRVGKSSCTGHCATGSCAFANGASSSGKTTSWATLGYCRCR